MYMEINTCVLKVTDGSYMFFTILVGSITNQLAAQKYVEKS